MIKHWLIVGIIIFTSSAYCNKHQDAYFFIAAINIVFSIKYMKRVKEEMRPLEPDHD